MVEKQWTVKITKKNGLQKVMDNVSISKMETERNINLFVSYYSNSLFRKLLENLPDDEYFYACNHRQMADIMDYLDIREEYFSILSDRIRILEKVEKYGAKHILNGIPYSFDNGKFVFLFPRSAVRDGTLIKDFNLKEDEVIGMKLFNEPALVYDEGNNLEEVVCAFADQRVILRISDVSLTKHLLKLYRKYLSARQLQEEEKKVERLIVVSYYDEARKIPKEYFYKRGNDWYFATLICLEASKIGLGDCLCLKEHDTYHITPVTTSEIMDILEEVDVNLETRNELLSYLKRAVDERINLLKSLAYHFSSNSVEDFLRDFLACKKFGFNPEDLVREALENIGENIAVQTVITTDVDKIVLSEDEDIKNSMIFFVEENMENIAVAVKGQLYVLKGDEIQVVERENTGKEKAGGLDR